MCYRIVADSSCDLYHFPRGSFVSVPLHIVTDNKVYRDDENLNVTEMIEDLAKYKGKSGTSCPNVTDWLDAFSGADVVFCVTITSALSGSYNSAVLAGKEYEAQSPEHHVYVIDSLSTGPEIVLLIEKLRECIECGMDREEIYRSVKEYQKQTHLLFALKSLNNLANNGRVNPAIAKISGVLGIQVLGKASDEGKIEMVGNHRGEKKLIKAIVSLMNKEGYKGGKLRISHCLCEETALRVKEAICEAFYTKDVVINPTTALCSFYAERGGLIIGFEA